MQKAPPVIAALQLRARYMLAGAVMLALWGASLVPLFRGTDDVHIITIFFATITVLPLGLIALLGGVSGSETSMRRAGIALFASGGLLTLVVVAEALRRMIFATGI
jgi:hypothetical protein